MLLMCFVFTVLGMQLFGSTLDPGEEDFARHSYATKTRFDTFFWSFVQVEGQSWVRLAWGSAVWALAMALMVSECSEKENTRPKKEPTHNRDGFSQFISRRKCAVAGNQLGSG